MGYDQWEKKTPICDGKKVDLPYFTASTELLYSNQENIET